jgi:hypothetical protein
MTRIAFRTALMAAALAASFGVSAQSAPPSESGARKGYQSAGAHEAAAARGAPGQLTTEYAANALARCAPLPAGFKEACEERVRGAGDRVGSVQGGGILRSSETTAPLSSMGDTLPPQASPAAIAAAEKPVAVKAGPKAKKAVKGKNTGYKKGVRKQVHKSTTQMNPEAISTSTKPANAKP